MPNHRSSKENPKETVKHTKKQQRLNAHEQQQKKNILTAAAIFAGVIVVILLIGLIDGLFITPNKAVASVGEDEITVEDFRTKVRYYRWQFIQQYYQTYQIYSMFGDYDGNQVSRLEYYDSLLNNPDQLGPVVLDAMIEDIIIEQKAQELGITVSDDAIEKAIESGFGFYPEGTPTSEPTPTTGVKPTLNAEQLLLVTATPTSIPTEIVDVETDESDESAVEETESDLTEATPAPTPTTYTVELYEENLAEYGRDLRSADLGVEDLREVQRLALLRDEVFDVITADIPATQEQVWARHILVEDETAVDSILGQLNSGQMSFSELALLFSLDEASAANGGDLGWFSRGQMVPEFEDAAFSLEVGEISEGIKTDFGYHIIQVIAHEDVPLSANEYEQVKQDAFSDWLAEERAALEPNISIDEKLLAAHTPTHPQLLDPDVYEAITGVTLKDARATSAAANKSATEQAKTLTAMPTSTEVAATVEPAEEE
ncbi:MAG: peptidylprolyl isomerase [Anaerolineae bacterium]|jgi:parvulin-like peptidyl-prolyl isomerase|nr:peptidylprolyl isomerase [Anaerolineae bacterium]